MAALVGPLIVVSGFGLYMLTNVFLGRFRRIPWEFLAVSAVGPPLAVALTLRDGGTVSLVGVVVSALLFAFLVWFFFGYSMYRAREDRPRVGERFPDFRLPPSDGAVFDLAASRGSCGNACASGETCESGTCTGGGGGGCGDGVCAVGESCPQDCGTETNCDDHVDNDGDGQTDCDDHDCANRSGGCDDTNPGGHGNSNGFCNPGGKKK